MQAGGKIEPGETALAALALARALREELSVGVAAATYLGRFALTPDRVMPFLPDPTLPKVN